MKTKLHEIEKEYVKLKNVPQYYRDITKRIFVKVVREKDMFSVLSVGVGMRLRLERRCLYEIARCA